MELFVSGSLAYDRIMDFEGLFGDHILPGKTHSLSVSFFVPTMRESFGGCAGNIAYTLALLGEKPTIVGSGGNDFAPYEAWLSEHGVDTSLIRQEESVRTAFATIMTDKADNQITAFYPGAMLMTYPLSDVAITKDDFVMISPSNPEMMRALPEASRKNAHGFIFDPGQQIPALSADDLKNGIKGAKALILNDYELELVAKKTGWSEEHMLAHMETLIVTMGEKGSRMRTKEKTILIPAAKAEAVDPTGAGDAYRAGFLTGIIRGLSLEIAGRMGAVAACYTVEREGTQTHTFTKEEFALRYKENFNETITL